MSGPQQPLVHKPPQCGTNDTLHFNTRTYAWLLLRAPRHVRAFFYARASTYASARDVCVPKAVAANSPVPSGFPDFASLKAYEHAVLALCLIVTSQKAKNPELPGFVVGKHQ